MGPKETADEVLVLGSERAGNERFGLLVRRLRLASGLTPKELAEKVAVTPAYLRMVERGERAPAAETARDLLISAGAIVEVEPIMAGGLRPDLLVTEPQGGTRWVIEFKGRMRAARGSAVESQLRLLLDQIADRRGEVVPVAQGATVDAVWPKVDVQLDTGGDQAENDLGRVVRLLSAAPPDVVRDVLRGLLMRREPQQESDGEMT